MKSPLTDVSQKHEWSITNALTVDVEDYYQVSAFENHYDRRAWSTYESRVERNTNLLLDLFSEHDVKGTFFTLGNIAERYPNLIRRIAKESHEIASHGYDHTRVTELTPATFREDVLKTKACLEDISGVAVNGYRAPTFSITEQNDWAYQILSETGHTYSSSIYPVKRDLYGNPNASRHPFHDPGSGVLEIPLTTASVLGKIVPCAGGGFFRLYPYKITQWLYRYVNQHENMPAIFYTHPWEYDPDQPRPGGLGFKTRFRHYLNLSKCAPRLAHLLHDFSWGRMDEVYLDSDNLTNVKQVVGA